MPTTPICQKTATLNFCQVVWRRYLGEIGKFYPALWLIYPKHCVSISIKIGQVIVDVMTKKGVFPPQSMFNSMLNT